MASGPGMAFGGMGGTGMATRAGAVMMMAPSMPPPAARAAAPGAPASDAGGSPKSPGGPMREQSRAEPDSKPKEERAAGGAPVERAAADPQQLCGDSVLCSGAAARQGRHRGRGV